MFALIYVSTETDRFTDTALKFLLTQSREKNVTLDITGLLLYKNVNFMQLLEGAEGDVRAVMEKIQVDSRHHNVQTLMEEEVAAREFSDWSMGFKKLGHETASEVPGYSDFLDVPLTWTEFVEEPSQAMRFLLLFKKSML